MATYKSAACFNHFFEGSLKNFTHDFCAQFLRKTKDVHAGRRSSSHGVDVAQRVSCGDATKPSGVINNGSEKIESLNERTFGSQKIHARIVSLVETHEEFGLMGLFETED